MSEYELNLLRQRGLAVRDSKARRGELRFSLPPGYCWNDVDQIEVDPDERVSETIKLMFRKFRELGSARCSSGPETQGSKSREIMQNPIHAGAYAFGRHTHRVQVVDGRARKTIGHRKPMHAWNVLTQDVARKNLNVLRAPKRSMEMLNVLNRGIAEAEIGGMSAL